MNKKLGGYVVLVAVISLLFAGCGGSNGDDVDLNAATSVTVSADKDIALANGSEDITLTAVVKNVEGTLLSGKAISFVVTAGIGSLHAVDAATNASGIATAKLNRGSISPPNTSEDVTVTVTADAASGTKTVTFINLLISLTSDKAIALANGNDPVNPERITLTAQVTNAVGSAFANKTISFAVTSGTGSLVNAAATTNASGIATVKLQRDPISAPNTREDITVTATVDSASGSKTVRFINLPATAAIEVALNRVVTDLAILTFDLVTAPTQSAPLFLEVKPIGAAITPPFIGPLGPGTQNTYAALLGGPNNTTYSLITSVIPGITTTVNGALVGFTYSIDPTITSLPTFTVTTLSTYFPAMTSGGVPVLPAVTQTDFVAATIFDTDK